MIFLGTGGVTSAQNPVTIPALAAVTGGNLTLYGIGAEPIVVDTEMSLYFQIAWSPDGQRLAYIGHDLQHLPVLKVIDLTQSVRIVLTNNVAINFPVSFTSDSRRVIYGARSTIAAPTPAEGERPDAYVDLMIQDTSVGSTPETLGTFPFGLGCTGGSSFPGDVIYGSEGGGFLAYEAILEPVPGGIVYSRDCSTRVTAVFSPSANRGYFLPEPIMQAVVSPSQLEVAGVQIEERRLANRIVIAGTDGQTISHLTTSAPVERVIWSTNGDALFYSTRQLVSTLPLSDNFRQLVQWEQTELPIYQVSIYRVNRADNAEQLVFTGNGYAIGRMIQTPDPNVILFSLVPNGDGWVTAIDFGALNPQAADYWSIADDYFPIELYRLDIATGTVTLLGTDLAMATLNTALWGQTPQ
jgi:hypothetical protein